MNWSDPSDPRKGVPDTPWLPPPAIERLEQIVTPEFDILEHGGGGSSVWFAERARTVTTMEHDSHWIKALIDLSLDNLMLTETVETEKRYDLFLIDGAPHEDRAEWITLAPQLVKRHGWVVLDNANREAYEKQVDELKELSASYERIKSGHGRYLMTDFFQLK